MRGRLKYNIMILSTAEGEIIVMLEESAVLTKTLAEPLAMVWVWRSGTSPVGLWPQSSRL